MRREMTLSRTLHARDCYRTEIDKASVAMIEMRIPLRLSVPLLLFGTYLIIVDIWTMCTRPMEVFAFQRGPVPVIVVLGFAIVGLIMMQVGLRNISRRPFSPTRHYLADWVLYPIGGIWVIVGLLNLLYGFIYGAPIFGVGVVLLGHTFRRPRQKEPTPIFRFQMPISRLNRWNKLFWSKNKALYVFVGALLVAWMCPWELLVSTRWHQALVDWMMPFMPGLQSLHDHADNPEFSVGLMSTVSILIVITMIIDLLMSQPADLVVSGEYPIRDAIKASIALSAWIAATVWIYPKLGSGNSFLTGLKQESQIYLAFQQISFISTINMSFILVLSFLKGLFIKWRPREGCEYE